MTVTTGQPDRPPEAEQTGMARMQDTEAWDQLARQQQKVWGSGEAVAAIEDIRDGYLAAGWPERAAEAEQVLEVAREDHAAALAGIDYRDLAELGAESIATPELAERYWPCGYPDTHADELALAERETNPEAGS
jgi:hypothetical protein